MGLNGVKVNMDINHKFLLEMAREQSNCSNSIISEEILFINKEILDSLELFFLEPKKVISIFRDKIICVYLSKHMTEQGLREIVCMFGVRNNDDENQFQTFLSFASVHHFFFSKFSTFNEFFSAKNDKFLKLEISK